MARLHGDPAFLDHLQTRFEGDFKIHYHLAPPLIPSKPDARGRPRKRAFGPWMQLAFRQLARLKKLRGSKFDPFGYTRERRMERALINDYQQLLSNITATLTLKNHADATRLASLVIEVRGYGPVKEQAVETYRNKVNLENSTLEG